MFLLKQLSKLPLSGSPPPREYGLVLALDEDGRITRNLHDPTGTHLWAIASAREHEGHLYLGTYSGDRIGRYRLNARSARDDAGRIRSSTHCGCHTTQPGAPVRQPGYRFSAPDASASVNWAMAQGNWRTVITSAASRSGLFGSIHR